MKTNQNATESGTINFLKSKGLPESSFTRWKNLGALSVSKLGFGGYRIDEEDPSHATALEAAIQRGVNLIDTSTNYGDGGSERVVGAILNKMFEAQALHREAIVVVSKIGYVQGQNLWLVKEREKSQRAFPDMVKYMDGCWHCIHPDFLSEQLTLSLERLHLEKLDVLLLHNPEYFLSDCKKKNLDAHSSRETFYRRIEVAFAHLEEEVRKGRIQCYGVSSNTFASHPDEFEATNVARMWEIASKISREHHFRVVQLPMNLFEWGAWENGTIATCEKLGLEVLVNRPLNAIVNNKLLRLAEFTPKPERASFESCLEEVRKWETVWANEIAPNVKVDSGSHQPRDFFAWASTLSQVLKLPYELEQWNYYRGSAIVPQVRYLFGELDKYFSSSPLKEKWTQWKSGYADHLDRLLDTIHDHFQSQANERSLSLKEKVRPLLPAVWQELPLSQLALLTLMNISGVSCVLNGMRSKAYVDDSLAALSAAQIPVSSNFLNALKSIMLLR